MGQIRSTRTAVHTDQLKKSDSTPTIKITPTEQKVLHWSSKGKTTYEIAIILNRTEATVNFHFANLRRKFEVSSRHSVLLHAIRLGLIPLP